MFKKDQKPLLTTKEIAEIEKHCIAMNHDACDRTGKCLACGPIEQSIRAANVLVTRWPRAAKRRSG